MNKVRYVCNDRSMSIEAEDLPGVRRIMVTIGVNNKTAWQFSFRASLDMAAQEKLSEILNRKTALACRRLVTMSKTEAEDLCEASKMMICLYAWQHLKEVRTKLGTIVWERA